MEKDIHSILQNTTRWMYQKNHVPIETLTESFSNQYNLLFEDTLDFENDIDFLYQNHFKPILERYNSNPIGVFKEITDAHQKRKLPILESKTDTSVLKSQIGILGHSLMPIELHFGFYYNNGFIPESKLIIYTPNLDIIYETGGENLKEHPLFSELQIKSTIKHELTHWYEEARYDLKITRALDAEGPNISDLFKVGSEIEIQAIVNSLADTKKALGQEKWDELEFDDLYKFESSLEALKQAVNDYRYSNMDRRKIARDILTRMAREGLIGKNMNGGPYFE